MIRNLSTAIFLLFVLSACTTLGIPAPETFNQRLAVAYNSVTATREAATKLLIAKQIGADDAQNALDVTNTARAGLDVAKDLAKTDIKAADTRLTAVRGALSALQAYLNSREVK